MQENLSKDIKFDEKGLVPAIAQDYKTGEVLMFAWMNKESIDETIKTNFAHYFSRSRQKLWKKGETSGHTQTVKEILIDCDNDCLILKVEQKGVACHTGARTCFFRNLLVIAVVCLTIFSGNSYANEVHKIDNITILSENNMSFPLVKISRIYSEKRNAVVSVNYDSSSALIQNINDGEPADVFISSHQDWIDSLKQRGLVDVYNLVNIARDKLFLVASKNNKKINIEEISKLNDLEIILQTIIKSGVPLIVDSEDTSLGKYSREILSNAKIPTQKFYSRLNEDKKSVLDQINGSDEYCGIVYASGIKHYGNIAVLKEIDKSDIYYQALVTAGDNMGKGRDFLKFIKSDEVKQILIDGGLVVE